MIRFRRHILAFGIALALLSPAVGFAVGESDLSDGSSLKSVPVRIVQAEDPDLVNDILGNKRDFGTGSGLGGENEEGRLVEIIGSIINAALGLLGVVLMGLLIYSGYLWMTAQGDAGQVKKAREIMVQAVMGMVIIMASYAISRFILQAIINRTSGQMLIE